MAKAENNRIRLPRFLSFPVISRWISPLASTDGFPPSGFPLAASPDGFPVASPAGFPRWLSPTVSRGLGFRWNPPVDKTSRPARSPTQKKRNHRPRQPEPILEHLHFLVTEKHGLSQEKIGFLFFIHKLSTG